jgi:hypothetical protein
MYRRELRVARGKPERNTPIINSRPRSLFHLSLVAQISPPWLPSVTDLVEQLPPTFRPSSILLIGFNGDKFSADLAAAFQVQYRVQ